MGRKKGEGGRDGERRKGGKGKGEREGKREKRVKTMITEKERIKRKGVKS